MFRKKNTTYGALDWFLDVTSCEIYVRMGAITKFDIGSSYEGRLMRELKLFFRTGKTIHAREWVTSDPCTYLIRELAFSRDADERGRESSLTVINVDGFVYSLEEVRQCEDPCSIVYSGAHAGSEREVKQLKNFINNKIPDGSIKVYIAPYAIAQAAPTPLVQYQSTAQTL
uniref:Peptidase M14 domain-containing protein n=1 Tax=Glossina palpalis gambiensis TaxID=67801 RepID=A0A1B0AW89_9MUSC